MTEKKDEKQGATLAQALVAIAREIKDPAKNAKNPHFGNTYANLDATIESVRELAAKHGIAVVQSPYYDNERTSIILYTKLIHEGGDEMNLEHSIPLSKPDPQGYGSALTYLRRYALQSLFNITGETDDDANQQPVNKVTQTRREPIDNSNPLAPADVERKYSKQSPLEPTDGWRTSQNKVEPPDESGREKLAVEINELAKIIGEHKGQSPRDVIADASSFENKEGKIVPGFTDPYETKRDGSYKASIKWLGNVLNTMREYCEKERLGVTE